MKNAPKSGSNKQCNKAEQKISDDKLALLSLESMPVFGDQKIVDTKANLCDFTEEHQQKTTQNAHLFVHLCSMRT